MTHRFVLLIVILVQVFETLAQKELNQDADVIYITFNQPQYAAGDTAFFRINIPITQEKHDKALINMALFKDGNQVLLQRTMVKDGVYAGYLSLTSNIVRGLYVLGVEINGIFYEGIFKVCSIDDKVKIFKTDSTFIFTDFGTQSYNMRENITVNVEAKEFTNEIVTVSIIRDDLFASENVVACNRTYQKDESSWSFS